MLRLLACLFLGIATVLNLSEQASNKVPAKAEEAAQTDWANCLACHLNTGAELPRLSQLRPAGIGNLSEDECLECHQIADLRAPRAKRTHQVRPVGAHLDCTMCHSAVPHGASLPPPRPVGDYNAEGCYECHRSVDAAQHMFSSHGGNPAVGCVDCHPAHESFEAAMPLDILPTSVLQSQGPGYDYYSSNSSCLRCHNSAALLGQLREGFVVLNTVNYHELHVLRGQSLCIECHEPHGSMYGSMLRGRLLDGSALTFRPGISGGSCSVRCHGVEHDNWSYVNKVH